MQERFLVHVFYVNSKKDTYVFPTIEKAEDFGKLFNDDTDIDFWYIEEEFVMN